MPAGVKITGIVNANRHLVKKAAEINALNQVALRKAALHLQNEVKSSIAGHRAEPTSVDTGRFLSSVDIEVGKFDAAIFTDVPYSQYLEYGTSKLTARRHFNNSRDRERFRIVQIVQNEINKVK